MKSRSLDEFNRFSGQGLIKSADLPVASITTDKKAALNRKGNELFNAGDIETAKKIFVTTGYSDGLSRVGDVYAKKGRVLEALKLYWLAHNRRKADKIVEDVAALIGTMLTDS